MSNDRSTGLPQYRASLEGSSGSEGAQDYIALQEVWAWKESVYQDIKCFSPDERVNYFHTGLADAVGILNATLTQNPDGTFQFVCD